MRVPLDKASSLLIPTAGTTRLFAATTGREVYVLERNGSVDRTIDPDEIEATETLATGYTTEAGATEVSYPLLSDADGRYSNAWYDQGSYDIYIPTDDLHPITRWEALSGEVLEGSPEYISVITELANVSFPDYGAVGDGIANDTDAINAALSSGRHVQLSKGDTYLIDGPLKMTTAGQHLYGNGATIKRRNQWSTTLSAGVSAGASTFSVTSAANIRVGQQLTIYDGSSSYEYTPDNEPLTVEGVAGTTITVDQPLSNSFLTGATVYLAFFGISVTAPDVVVEDLTFNGNKSHYTFSRFQTTVDLEATEGSDRLKVRGCYFYDSPGEAIVVTDSADVEIEGNAIINCNGNGIHPGSNTGTGCVATRIVGNYVKNCNLDTSVAHADGAICISNFVSDLLVDGNYLDNALCGVGATSTVDNSDATIVNNTIRNMTRNAIDGFQGSDGTYAERILVESNRIYDCEEFRVSTGYDEGATGFAKNWIVRNNYFYKTPVFLNYVGPVPLSGNTFDADDDDTMTLLTLRAVRDTPIDRSNVFLGGAIGVSVEDPSLVSGYLGPHGFTANLEIDGTFVGQRDTSILCPQNDFNGVTVSGKIRADSDTMATDYCGIEVGGRVRVTNAGVLLPSDAGASAVGIRLHENAICKNSEVVTQGSSAKSIHVVARPVNEIAADSANFETDTGGWVTSGYGAINPASSITRVTTQHYSGVAAGRVITPGSLIKEGVAVDFGPVTNGLPYIGSIYLKGNSGGELVEVFLYDRITGDAPDGSPVAVTLTTEWTRVFAAAGAIPGPGIKWTPTMTNSNATLVVRNQGTAAYTYFIDAAQVVQTDEVPTYFDPAVNTDTAIVKNNETDVAIDDDGTDTVLDGNEIIA